MAFLSPRKSRGKTYWSICESRRINGKPRNIPLEYLGTAETLLNRLKEETEVTIKSYSHGDTSVLFNTALELDVINIINKNIPKNKNDLKQTRDGLSIGASALLAAIGRVCHPTSKMGWYDWCKETSLEYCLRKDLKNLDSQHFWDQMDGIPEESIPLIEEQIVDNIIKNNNIKMDLLFYDTTNFFTFINSKNNRCEIPKRGKNKQRRTDLRQIGMALIVTREDQIPLLHNAYEGNKNDITTFKNNFHKIVDRIKNITEDLTDVTLVFDKGNNSKENFKKIDDEKELYYVAGLVPSHFKDLIKEANKNFSTIKIDDEEIPVYRIKKTIWGQERTCVVTVSKQLREGQIQGIYQHLEKKYKKLEDFKKQLENPKKRKSFEKKELENRLRKIIKGQFIDEILKYDLIELKNNDYSFTYYINEDEFERLKKEILGRKILTTNRHDWKEVDIILAYKGQSKVEYVFRNIKNPYHLAIRPQYHWTDQKIKIHVMLCMIGYMLAITAYSKARKQANYKRNIDNFLNDLKSIRLACIAKKKSKKLNFQLENVSKSLIKIAKIFNIKNDSIRHKSSCCDYI